MQHYDIAVIGGGIAGVSVGRELSADRSVVVLDMERTLAFHTTGRSAAMFLEAYGGPTIRALTTAGRAYFQDAQLLTPMPALYVARPGRGDAIRELHRDVAGLAPGVEILDADAAVALQPLLRREQVELALFEPGAMEIDVHGLHQGYVHELRACGGEIVTSARIVSAAEGTDGWTFDDCTGRRWRASVVVDAAGAWADEIAKVFGAAPVDLRPLRRSAFMVDAPPGVHPPMVSDIDEVYYFKPDAGRLLCSPADETPQEPADARPDELEIARAIEAINESTTLDVRHVRASWAGLRTFVADRNPVVGYDPRIKGFFWLAGQGGYGIQTAPALARTAAALVRGEPVPNDVSARGLRAQMVSPDRCAL